MLTLEVKRLSSKFWVYLIKCTNPKNNRVAWYVGWTQRDPETRLVEHIQGTGNAFLHSAIKHGCTVEIHCKEWFYYHKESTNREAHLINQLRKRLLNIKLESFKVKTRISEKGNTLNYINAKTNFEHLLGKDVKIIKKLEILSIHPSKK